ncbi:MAG: putative sugar nucleotidyl transferase, partial [Bacteroidota bacterium]
QESSDQLIINSCICPTGELVAKLNNLKNGQVLFNNDHWVGLKTSKPDWKAIEEQKFNGLDMVKCDDDPIIIEQPWHIFRQNGRAIREDFALVTKGRTSAGITDPHTKVYGEENIFIEEDVEIKAAVINASDGPVYLGKNSMIHEGALIKGPLALCEGAHINMGAKMRGDNTIGPYSKVGGEVSNSVIFGYSNKAHAGFLGNSVLGEWCNIGADTNTSNLKNNYTSIKLWNYARERFIDTGLQFCGLMMGDHSKAGINTMFNTGTVVGVGANIFGDGFPRTFIPSFAWGGASGFSTFKLSK